MPPPRESAEARLTRELHAERDKRSSLEQELAAERERRSALERCLSDKDQGAVDASTTTFLRSIPAFQGFGEGQLQRVRGALRTRAYGPRETLLEQGAAVSEDAFFILTKGRVRVFVDGRQVAVLSAGDYVGERALILKEPRASTCIADATGCSCLVLDAESFEEAILARASEDLSPSKARRRKSCWARSFHAYAHNAADAGAGRLGAFAADYAALLPEALLSDGDRVETCADALAGDFSSSIAAELRLLLLEELTPELSVDEAITRILALAERVFAGKVSMHYPVESRPAVSEGALAAPVTSEGRLLATLEVRGAVSAEGWAAASPIFTGALAPALAAKPDTADEPPLPPPPFHGDRAALDRALDAHALHLPSQDEKRLLWAARDVLTDRPRALPRVLLAVDWGSPRQVKEAHRLLHIWTPLAPLPALQLLTKRFPDSRVRAFAVTCLETLDDADLAAVTLQLVQVVKHDTSHDTALNRFLLKRALRSPLVCGHALYWSLATERETGQSCRVLHDLYARTCGAYRSKLGHQVLLVKRLSAIATKLASVKAVDRDGTLRKLLSETVLAPTFQLPLSPYMVCSSLDIEKCRVLGSAKAPLWLEFTNAVKDAAPHVVIFKTGDDLRQDQLVLQLLRAMDALWKKRGLNLKISPYGCVATGPSEGFIEVVPHSSTLAAITSQAALPHSPLKTVRKLAASYEAYCGSDALLKWLTRAASETTAPPSFGPPGSFRHAGLAPATQLPPAPKWRTSRRREETNPLQEGARVYGVLDAFVRSLAGYSVAMQVLGVGDRHNDNIMVSRDGCYFHVDFGHFLGHFKAKFGVKREASSFVLTPHMETVLGWRAVSDLRHAVAATLPRRRAWRGLPLPALRGAVL